MAIPFVAAVPFERQDSAWPRESQETYQRLLFMAYRVFVISSGRYAPWKMQKRNEWIVDNSEVMLACWDGSESGTANCVHYAERRQKPIVWIDPRTMEMTHAQP